MAASLRLILNRAAFAGRSGRHPRSRASQGSKAVWNSCVSRNGNRVRSSGPSA